MSNSSSVHERLIETNSLLHVATVGAGMRLQTLLWGTPGASAYLAGFDAPYAKTQLTAFLGFDPQAAFANQEIPSCCSKEVAFDMAITAYIRAAEVCVAEKLDKNPVGIGITASVATNRMPRGDQRYHGCIITNESVDYFERVLEKEEGFLARGGHDDIIAQETLEVILNVVAERPIAFSSAHVDFARKRLFRHPVFLPDGTRGPANHSGGGLFLPASLNPIHKGHRNMVYYARAKHPAPVTFLISSTPTAKAPLTLQQMLRRAGMMRAERWTQHQIHAFEFTQNEPLFIDMARNRPMATFIVGTDTMSRFLDPKWGPHIPSMLKEMEDLNVSFLVMPRKADGKVTTCEDVNPLSVVSGMFMPLAAPECAVDYSSTAIREECGHGV